MLVCYSLEFGSYFFVYWPVLFAVLKHSITIANLILHRTEITFSLWLLEGAIVARLCECVLESRKNAWEKENGSEEKTVDLLPR